MSLQKFKSVHTASKRQYAAAGEVHVPCGGIHKWKKTKQGDWYTDWKSKYSSAWALSLCTDKTRAFNYCRTVSFPIGLSIDPYLWSWFLGNDWKSAISSISYRNGTFCEEFTAGMQPAWDTRRGPKSFLRGGLNFTMFNSLKLYPTHFSRVLPLRPPLVTSLVHSTTLHSKGCSCEIRQVLNACRATPPRKREILATFGSDMCSECPRKDRQANPADYT